jgi:serine phosphatase RsbU (regulator of sigma subunit)
MALRIKNILFTLILAFPILFKAQEKQIYSWCDSADKYKQSDFIKSKYYADTAVISAKNMGNDRVITGALNALGNTFLNNGNYDLALEQFNLAETYARRSGKRQLLAKIIGNQALTYEHMGDYKKSFDKQFKALAIRQELNIPGELAISYQNMAATYFYIGDANSSVNSTLKAIAIIEKGKDYKLLGQLFDNLGAIYFSQYKDSLMMEAYRKSLKYSQLAKDKEGEASVYLNLVSFYNETGRPQKAMEYLNISRQLDSDISTEQSIDVSMNMGITQQNLGRDDSALIYFNKALATARKVGFRRKITEVYDALYAYYGEKKDYKNALEFRNRFYSLNDSIAGEKNLKNIAELEAIYKTEKKNKEIEILNAENKIQKEKTENNRKLLWVSLAALVLALFAAVAFYRNFRNKKCDNIILQSKNEEIQKQKDLIAEKNKEIVDSITYAKRLQEAILPSVESIQKQLPQSFVLYKPKDIVAGDFYWMHVFSGQETGGSMQSVNSLLIAVADCTGHGVPGAMVSVVCANALNAAVKEFKLTEPAKILDKVNELVEEAFGKSASEVRDGMDISLVKIELINANPDNKLPKGKLVIPKGQSLADVVEAAKKYTIEWAGANNPLWYIEEGEWKEIKADKQPVGKFISRKPFTNNSIQLKVSDSLFLISDGFADQFGGEEGKKMKNKILKNLLYKNSGQNSQLQKQALEKEFDSWKAGYDQVDDVCIIGIKL